MGADFMVYCCESPSDYAKAMPMIEYRVESLDDNTLDSIASDVLWYEAQEISDEVSQEAGDESSAEHSLKEEDLWKLDDLINIKIRNMVKRRIMQAVEEVFGESYRRDVAQVFLHNRCYLMTGGMSSGDLPTEACDMINLIEYSGITDGMSLPDFDYESIKA